MTIKDMLSQVETEIARLRAELSEFERLRDVIKQSSLSPSTQIDGPHLQKPSSTKTTISALERLEKAKARAAEEAHVVPPKKQKSVRQRTS